MKAEGRIYKSVNMGIIGSDNIFSLVAPSYYLNQLSVIVNWKLRNKLKRKFEYKYKGYIKPR